MGQNPWDSLVNNSWDLYVFIENMEQVLQVLPGAHSFDD